MVRIMILPNVKDVVSIILTMKMMILCCVITVKSAGIMGLSQLDFEDLRGYAIMIKVLFICHGNICRSPMAEFVMKKLVSDANFADHFQIASAATSTEEIGNPVYPPARRKLAEHQISCAGKTARQLRREDYQEYDFLVGMDHANLCNMRRMLGGDPEGKLSLLLDHAGRSGEEIADPWYTGDFEETYRDVLAGCQGLLDQIQGTHHL